MAVEYVHDGADMTDVVLRDQIAGLLFILLPKLVLTLKNVALGDEKQGHTLIAVRYRN